MLDAQTDLELNYSSRNLNHLFKEHEANLIAAPMAFVTKFLETPFDVAKRPDLVDVHAELRRKHKQLPDTLFSMITFVLAKRDITLQALVGKIFNGFKCETFRRRTVLIEVLLQALLECPYIRIERKGDYMYFQSRLSLNDGMLDKLADQGFVLPMLYATRVTSNDSIGYTTFEEHVVSGGKLKEHDKDVCLDHLNRVNATFYSYEPRLGLMVQPKFDATPKLLDNGEYETIAEITKREMSFHQLHAELPAKVRIMLRHGNRFNLMHKYCNRVRTYVKSYHFNYQGTKFLKAMVAFDNKELTTGEF